MIVIDGENYLPINKVAARRGVPESTVRSAIHRGVLASVKDPDVGCRVIKVTDADTWIIGTVGGKRPGAGRKKSPATEEE